MSPAATRLAFDLPAALEAGAPPESRGIGRDGVRMMVSYRTGTRLFHSTFAFLPELLEPDDIVVINTSGTLPAALGGIDAASGRPVIVHLSTRLDDGRWVVEPRLPSGGASVRWPAEAGPPPARILLGEDGSSIEMETPYRGGRRLWVARLHQPGPEPAWLAEHGLPIRYRYVDRAFPLSDYQTVYSNEAGSAEMPSAGRPFTAEVITRLVSKGVGISPLLLHTGVASPGADELPYPEPVRVPASTAARVNAARRNGGRVVAVGTTVVRALETAWDRASGEVRAYEGWTEVIVSPERGVFAVNGLLTGWHEPEASHLLMLEAIAGRPLLEESYAASLDGGYLWHEFGDVHLILP